MANVIQVVSDGKKWKVLVDYLQQGVLLSSPSLANREAKSYKAKHSPNATLYLAPVEETVTAIIEWIESHVRPEPKHPFK